MMGFCRRTFAMRLLQQRFYRGITLKQAAKGIGTKGFYLSQLEKNHRTPGAELLVQIADFYHCSVDYLCGR